MSVKEPVSTKEFIEGIGGRLAKNKSEAYIRAVMAVEGRSNQFTARHMLVGDLAFVLSATELGITPPDSAKAIVKCLLDMIPRAGELGRDNAVGDIVFQREVWVADVVGRDTGAWQHIGRHRAESLRGYLPRMFFRDALCREREAMLRLVRVLVDKAAPVLTAYAPVYHHLQHAGYTTLGEYLLGFAENLSDHIERFAQIEQRLDYAPPAHSGRPVLVKLAERASQRLGFKRVQLLRQQGHLTEEQFSEPFFALVLPTVAMARMAEDLRLWMTPEFDFFELADEHASISSGLPQKKNPFGLQAIIGGAAVGAGRIAGQLASNIALSSEADTVYHMGSLFQYANDVVHWTEFLAEIIERGTFNLPELERKSKWGYAGASEAMDTLIFDHGLPQRVAHHMLGAIVRAAVGGADQEALLAQLKPELAEHPGIDAQRILGILKGEILLDTAINIPAAKTMHRNLEQKLQVLEKQVYRNEVADAANRLLEEGRRFCAR